MKAVRLSVLALLCALVSAGIALASWYDDYDAGVDAALKGQWQTVVQKMTAAINGNPNESNKARTYGAIFINYHPYYYRGVAYLNLGKYQQAISDFERTSGPGAEDLGSLDALMQRAKDRLAAATATPPLETARPQVTTTVAPAPSTTQQPAIDNALRTRARAALDQAKTHLQSAQQRKATTSQQYQSALNAYTAANSRLATVKNNDDLNAIIAEAENVTLLADSATAATVATTAPAPPRTAPATRSSSAAQTVLGDTSRRLHRALQDYFSGDFDKAEQGFQELSKEMPKNAWIWAFLGASQYSQYAFEGEDSYKAAAITSFRKAKTYGRWKDGLPEKYFSRRIRKAFKETAG
ncbi:MAG TPA: hypothetical protein VF980_09370 [Thermoanaerobaculia bacterium]